MAETCPTRPDAVGCYISSSAEIWVLWGNRARASILRHEAVHHFQAGTGLAQAEPWLREALAEYLEDPVSLDTRSGRQRAARRAFAVMSSFSDRSCDVASIVDGRRGGEGDELWGLGAFMAQRMPAELREIATGHDSASAQRVDAVWRSRQLEESLVSNPAAIWDFLWTDLKGKHHGIRSLCAVD